MDLVALNLCIITTRAWSLTLQPDVEWNATLIHCGTLAAVNSTTCQVTKLTHYERYITHGCALRCVRSD